MSQNNAAIRHSSFMLTLLISTILLVGCNLVQQEAVEETATPPPTEGATKEAKLQEAVVSKERGVWTLDTGASQFRWTASRMVAKPHSGMIGITKGGLWVNEAGIQGGEFSIDMNRITEDGNNERFISHIKGADFFDVGNFPDAHFTITHLEKMSANQVGTEEYQVTGDLTFHGKTNSITFPAELSGGGDVLSATAEFEIDRTRWGITFDSGSFFKDLGDRAIKNEIGIGLNLIFRIEE